jgi:hypothetical protein
VGTVKRKHIFLSDAQLKALGEVRKSSGLSLAEVIRRAVDEYLERRPKKSSTTSRKEFK